MRIQSLTPGHDRELTRFLEQLGAVQPCVLGYHYPFFRDMLADLGLGRPLYFGAWSAEELVGILPGFIRAGATGAAYCSLPFFGPNAGVICAPHCDERAIHNALLRAAVEHLATFRIS
ncbi:MAG TPA: hypothetical protein VH475_27220 [Tepidisphaeraceae bacterium]|jgi:hypothetical protein